ncbi:MAG: type I-U CRISPR-associated protein Cas5/Cas6 [Planctomycetaceae bacterium]|nr:type I-U CRISPR-associated protein Cas5/Cas6 [Planctomycetaceae bacterium]
MPTIEISFPGGRYHATPWGHHVNEGQIEWPPCPWRLLRALIAAGFNTQGWTEIPETARSLIEKLASTLPEYELPQVSVAHSRHYMPTGELSKGTEKTTLVFDTWANVANGQMRVRWDCELNESESELFRRLVEAVGYLGRSESWIDAKVIPDVDFDQQRSAVAHTKGMYPGPNWEQIMLTAPLAPSDYQQWQQQRVDEALTEFPLPEGKKKPPAALQKKRDAAIVPYPKDLIECLLKDTNWWKKEHNWSQPPGSQRVLYWRRSDALQVATPQRRQLPREHRVEVMLLALSTPSRNKSGLPHVSRTLPQAELIHRAIVGRAGQGQRINCPELTGRDDAGRPLQGGHRHAHILPLDLDGDKHLDHILIYASMGLGSRAQSAIRGLKRTWTKGGVNLQVSLVGAGCLNQLRTLHEPLSRGIQTILGPIEGSRVWISKTPFVPPRHLKSRGRNTLFGQVAAELSSRGLRVASSIDRIDTNDTHTLRHFVRVRRHGGNAPPLNAGFILRMEFPKPVQGPLTLGYGGHFGMGLFQTE